MEIGVNDKSSHKQCFKCQYLPCINLYSDTEGRYGELYVLSKYKDVGIPPCSIGVFMYSLCQLTRHIYEKTQSPALEMYIQGLRDFKASIILLFTGHYRTSIALLRSVLEMFLVGIYFDARYFSAENEKKAEEILLEIEDFLNEKYEVPKEIRLLANQPHKKKLDYSLILEYLTRMGGIYKGHEKYLKRLKRDFLIPYVPIYLIFEFLLVLYCLLKRFYLQAKGRKIVWRSLYDGYYHRGRKLVMR